MANFRSIGDLNMASAGIPVNTDSALGPRIRRKAVEPEFLPVAAGAPETSIRRLEAFLARVGSAEEGTQVGLMKIRGEISEAQWAACDWFAQLHEKYLLAMDAKQIKSGSAELVSKAEPPDPFSDAGKTAAKRDAKIVAEYRSAQLAGIVCGGDNWKFFCRVVLEEMVPHWPARRAVDAVSRELAAHRRRESKRRRGRQGR